MLLHENSNSIANPKTMRKHHLPVQVCMLNSSLDELHNYLLLSCNIINFSGYLMIYSVDVAIPFYTYKWHCAYSSSCHGVCVLTFQSLYQLLVPVSIRGGHFWPLLWDIDHSVTHCLLLSVSQLGHELVKVARKIITETYESVKESIFLICFFLPG